LPQWHFQGKTSGFNVWITRIEPDLVPWKQHIFLWLGWGRVL